MLHRELRHPKTGQSCQVTVSDVTFIHDMPDGSSTHMSFRTEGPEKAREAGLKALKGRLREGFVETDASLSFRFLTKTEGKGQRFWWIRLDGTACDIRFGKYPCDNLMSHGQGQKKFAPDADAARAEYDKQLAKKFKEGYVEQDPRDTPYSKPASAASTGGAPSKDGAPAKGKAVGAAKKQDAAPAAPADTVLARELRHPTSGKTFSIWVRDDHFEKFIDHDGKVGSLGTAAAAMSEGLKELKKFQKQGLVETEVSLSTRFFEKSEGDKLSYWCIRLKNGACEAWWGDGPSRPAIRAYEGKEKKTFYPTEAEARAAYDAAIAKKLKAGFVERGARDTPYATPAAVAPPATQPQKAAGSSKKAAPASAPPASAPAAAAASDPAQPRRFVFDDGSSRKFWTIAIDGSSHNVQFGRLGTDGQAQTKDFGSPAAAKTAYDKLVAEKVKKGYVEEAAAAGSSAAPPTAKAAAKSTKGAKKAAGGDAAATDKDAADGSAIAVRSAPAAPPAQVVTEVTHRIALDPRDWAYALWRDPDPAPRPDPRPFDLDDLCDKLLRGGKKHGVNVSVLAEPEGMSREEAHFWVEVSILSAKSKNPYDVVASLKGKDFTGRVDRKKLDKFGAASDLTAACMSLLLTPEEYIEAAIAWDLRDSLLLTRTFVCYLSRAERKRLGRIVAERASKAAPGKNVQYYDFPTEWALAAAFGCSDVLPPILAQLNQYNASSLMFGLGSAAEVEAYADQLVASVFLRWGEPEFRAWIAHTETRRLDIPLNQALALRKDDAVKPVRAMACIKDPVVAPPLLKCQQAGRGGEVATAWLDEQVGNAVAGLIAISGRDALARPALDYLRTKKRAGFEKVIEQALAGQPAGVADRIRTEVLDYEEPGKFTFDPKSTPKWLSAAVAEAAALKPAKGSEFAKPEKLPPLVVGDHRLAADQVEAVLLALQHSELGAPHALVKELREKATIASRDDFAWSLFDVWIANSAPTPQKWAMRALGHLGADGTVLRLTPLVRAWPGESQHPRAVLGLECLRAIGTNAALMQLSSIGQKLKFKALQQKAIEFVEAIAADMGLTKDELEDRVVSDCGLDENGTATFDFGPRKFTFAFDSDLKPAVRDADGQVRKDLPKPSARDDAEKAKAAAAAFGDLKKQLRDVLKLQGLRLEQALVTGRRWPKDDFRTLLVEHPLMGHFARRLLWSGFDGKGKRLETFRITDEGDAADSSDEPLKLDKADSVGIVHPLHLTENERAKWGEVFSDYELIPPFPQLGRPIYALTPKEEKQQDVMRCRDAKVPAAKLLGTLERLGWTRGPAQDNGVFMEHFKHFRTFDVTASIVYDRGIAYGMIADEEDQEITGCCFLKGLYKPRGWPHHKPADKIALGKIDPVVVSEVIADLAEATGQSA